MFSRIRIASGLALLLALVSSIAVAAKGGFSFISISGPNLKDEVRATDSALTDDFFAFWDFYLSEVKAPVEPGPGYEITRYYVDGTREIAFDHLHYYPDAGFVYYDGIINGSSEYDGEWYTARPDIKTIFESTLPITPMVQSQPNSSVSELQSQSSQPIAQPPLVLLISLIAGIMVILAFAFRRGRSLAQ
jgi:hypothetical protein